MKNKKNNYLKTSLIIILIVIIVFAFISFYKINKEKDTPLFTTPKEKNINSVENYIVNNLPEYKEYNGKNLKLLDEPIIVEKYCESCYLYKYEFDIELEKNYPPIITGFLINIVYDGEKIVDVISTPLPPYVDESVNETA